MTKILEIAMIVAGFVLLVLVVAALLTIPVWLLWNWVMPVLGVAKLTLLQSWGMLMLCSVLFTPKTSSKGKS